MKIGELIIKLQDIKDKSKPIYFTGLFGEIYPINKDDYGSWRGDYAEFYLGYKALEDNEKFMNTQELIDLLKSCIGKKFDGYKGGIFVMDADTQLFVSKASHADEVSIIEIHDFSKTEWSNSIHLVLGKVEYHPRFVNDLKWQKQLIELGILKEDE